MRSPYRPLVCSPAPRHILFPASFLPPVLPALPLQGAPGGGAGGAVHCHPPLKGQLCFVEDKCNGEERWQSAESSWSPSWTRCDPEPRPTYRGWAAGS